MPKAKPKPLNPVTDFPEPVKKQSDLPGMENRGIPELEEAARKYAAIRDKRMALNDAEVKLKDLLLGLLKKHDKREYHHDGIKIWIKVEEETVKVKIEEEEEPDAIRNKAKSRGAHSTSEGSTQSSSGTPDEGRGANQEAHSQDRATRSQTEPGEGAEF